MRQFDVTPAYRMELLRIKEAIDKDLGGIQGKSIAQMRFGDLLTVTRS